MWSIKKSVLISAISLGALAACASDDGNGFDATTDPVTDINHSIVKRQAIGNCWIYATAGWVESLNKSTLANSKTELNVSESYWSYWHWFEQIANGGIDEGQLATGGSFYVASNLITRYGVIAEGDFIAEEATAEMSTRQKTALDAVNASLKSGPLAKPEVRRNRALVRAELDKAWQLAPKVTAVLDKVFGKDVSKTLDRAASNAGTPILQASQIPVQLVDPTTKQATKRSLKDALSGTFAWKEAYYPSDAKQRREFLRRVQKALHDKQPVIISWFVDFNAMEAEGKFKAPPATVGRQGGHMVSLEDYEITNVPGFGTIKAGETVTDKKELEAALSDQAEIVFLRIKNSWGTLRPDRQFTTGYHDLYMKYLNGPMKECEEKADGTTDTTNCHDGVPLSDVVLPAGY